MDGRSDVIVIGGGLAGLSSAAYLARAGVTVTLFEKATNPGGRAATQIHNNYAFNRGGHALYPGGAASQALQELEVSYKHGSPRGLVTQYQNKFHTYPGSIPGLLSTKLLDIADKWELMRIFASLGTLKPRDVGRLSVQNWLERHSKQPQVRRVLAATAYTLTYSAALDQVSMEPFVTQAQLSLKQNVHYIHGGWQTLADGLRQVAEQAGAHIVTGSRVEAIERPEGHVEGVRLSDGSRHRSRAVVVATEAQDAARIIDDPTLNRSIDTLVPTQVACLDIALRRLPRPDHPVVFDLDNPHFYSAQSLFARVAPEGGVLIHAFRYLDPAHSTDSSEHERNLEAFLDTAQPGWRNEVVKRFFLPHMEVTSSLPLASSDGLAGRPQVRVPHITGLYLAGDWIGQEGYLLDASMASARQAAHLLLRDELRPIPATALKAQRT